MEGKKLNSKGKVTLCTSYTHNDGSFSWPTFWPLPVQEWSRPRCRPTVPLFWMLIIRMSAVPCFRQPSMPTCCYTYHACSYLPISLTIVVYGLAFCSGHSWCWSGQILGCWCPSIMETSSQFFSVTSLHWAVKHSFAIQLLSWLTIGSARMSEVLLPG